MVSLGCGRVIASGSAVSIISQTSIEIDAASVTCFDHGTTVYCLTVQGASSFFANGFLVHNCLECADMDGEIFDVDEVDPPPLHSSCRCVLIAVVAHASKLSRAPRHKKAMRYVKPADRAMLDGKPPPRIKYGAWLKAQPASVQDEALGPKRGRLFRIGKLQLNRFVGRYHKILTLAELKKNDRAAWKRAGLE